MVLLHIAGHVKFRPLPIGFRPGCVSTALKRANECLCVFSVFALLLHSNLRTHCRKSCHVQATIGAQQVLPFHHTVIDQLLQRWVSLELLQRWVSLDLLRAIPVTVEAFALVTATPTVCLR